MNAKRITALALVLVMTLLLAACGSNNNGGKTEVTMTAAEVLNNLKKSLGDSYTSDIAGAMEAGWKTIWLDKNRTETQNERKKADLTVNTEEQLLKRIKGNR